ncbi:MAG: VOC family protein [Rhodocyclaceae bacterium]|nr:VOC family protein [Rhodocyclaceae bacterium]
MSAISGLYEIAVPVRDLARAVDFYVHLLGFQPALTDRRRRWQFLRLGSTAMLVLQHAATPHRLHLALRVSEHDLDGWHRRLRGYGLPVAGPVALPWLPARSLYFADPDGHDLELIALADQPREAEE